MYNASGSSSSKVGFSELTTCETEKEKGISRSDTKRPSADRQMGQQANEPPAKACCRCNTNNSNNNNELHRRPTASHVAGVKRPVEFSADMLKDQELLVATLSQQGISEALIQRQFNKLLEEQSKQLSRQRDSAAPASGNNNGSNNGNNNGNNKPSEETSSSCNRARGVAGERSAQQPTASLSLAKLRSKRELQEARSRNNGLQDLATAAQIIDKSKPLSSASGGNVPGAAARRFRLDGTQDSAAPECEDFCRAHSLRRASELPVANVKRQSPPANLSANGLANSARREAAEAAPPAELDLERDLADNEAELRQASPSASASSSLRQFPDIQEPRVFGGFTYFARKPQSIPQSMPRNAQPPAQAPTVQPVKCCQRKSLCAS